MAAATSSGTSFSSISQEKKLSPASPDQSVPSQSKAAKRGSSRRTDSTKAWALSATTDEDTVFPERFISAQDSNARPVLGSWQRVDCNGCGGRCGVGVQKQEPLTAKIAKVARRSRRKIAEQIATNDPRSVRV